MGYYSIGYLFLLSWVKLVSVRDLMDLHLAAILQLGVLI